MKRQAFLFLCAVSFAPGCVLDIEVLDGVGDDYGDSEDTDTSAADAESSSSTTDAESSSSTTDAESSSSTTDAESSSSTTDWESSSTGLADAPPDCEEAQLEYEALVAMTECVSDADCKIIDGHCSVGLGACFYAVNVEVDEAFLDTLAQIWSEGCEGGVCDCPVTPDQAVCDAGTCVPG